MERERVMMMWKRGMMVMKMTESEGREGSEVSEVRRWDGIK